MTALNNLYINSRAFPPKQLVTALHAAVQQHFRTHNFSATSLASWNTNMERLLDAISAINPELDDIPLTWHEVPEEQLPNEPAPYFQESQTELQTPPKAKRSRSELVTSAASAESPGASSSSSNSSSAAPVEPSFKREFFPRFQDDYKAPGSPSPSKSEASTQSPNSESPELVRSALKRKRDATANAPDA